VVERFSCLLDCEHFYQCETEQAAEPADEVEGLLTTFDEIRPHERRGQRAPLLMHRLQPHLLAILALQEA
jgi:hypothetical protein